MTIGGWQSVVHSKSSFELDMFGDVTIYYAFLLRACKYPTYPIRRYSSCHGYLMSPTGSATSKHSIPGRLLDFISSGWVPGGSSLVRIDVVK